MRRFHSTISSKFFLVRACCVCRCFAGRYSDEELGEDDYVVNFARVRRTNDIDVDKYEKELVHADDIKKEQRVEICKQVTVIVHSIDGQALRAPELQDLLSDIAGTPEVQLIASIDDTHIMWSKEMLERFRWWWTPMHTFQTYNLEYPLHRSRIVKHVQTFAQRLNTFSDVVSALPKKSRQCLLVLVELQIEAARNGVKQTWISKETWAAKAGIYGRLMGNWIKEWEASKGGWLEDKNQSGSYFRIRGVNMAELRQVKDMIERVIKEKKDDKDK